MTVHHPESLDFDPDAVSEWDSGLSFLGNNMRRKCSETFGSQRNAVGQRWLTDHQNSVLHFPP